MSKLNTRSARPAPVSPLTSTVVPGAKTYEGGKGAVSDSKTELFRLGVNLFYGGEKTYYESGKSRDSRFTNLVEQNALSDPLWAMNFLIWLRGTANIRTASVVGAAHFVHARLSSSSAVQEDELLSSLGHKGMNRHIISEVLSRADEPGEFVSYWLNNFGKKLPKPVKRGIADSVLKLYSEYSVLKYNTASHAIRFSDVLNLAHPVPDKPWRADLFKYIIGKRYGDVSLAEFSSLPMIKANDLLRSQVSSDVSILTDPEALKAAGFTWEDALSLGGSKIDKKKLWEAIIPNMGVFALVRNLRNFDEAGISKESRDFVISKLTDPKVIANSRMFPYSFLSAFNETGNLHYQSALETAVDLATQNIPEFSDGTLVLIDTSGSMSATISNKSKMTRAGTAALFGAAVAAKNPGKVTVVMYGTTSKELIIKPGTSILNIVKEVDRRNDEVGSGTNTSTALRKHFDSKKHKRVFIFSDLQSFPPSRGYYAHETNVADFNFGDSFAYAFDLGGYKITDTAVGKDRKYQLAGLSDATFKLVSMLENLGEGHWPWEITND